MQELIATGGLINYAREEIKESKWVTNNIK
jgi:hypothetical protein